MFPFVATAEEWWAANSLLERELVEQRTKHGICPTSIARGVMIEIPSLVDELPVILPELDFISIGSNDLLQYYYAADRNNPRLHHRYDSLSPGFLGLLRRILVLAAAHDTPVSLCGEMASRPLEALALIGLGFRTISVSPSSLDLVKTMIRSIHLAGLERFIQEHMNRHARRIRPELLAYAQDHAIILDYQH